MRARTDHALPGRVFRSLVTAGATVTELWTCARCDGRRTEARGTRRFAGRASCGCCGQPTRARHRRVSPSTAWSGRSERAIVLRARTRATRNGLGTELMARGHPPTLRHRRAPVDQPVQGSGRAPGGESATEAGANRSRHRARTEDPARALDLVADLGLALLPTPDPGAISGIRFSAQLRRVGLLPQLHVDRIACRAARWRGVGTIRVHKCKHLR